MESYGNYLKKCLKWAYMSKNEVIFWKLRRKSANTAARNTRQPQETANFAALYVLQPKPNEGGSNGQ